MKNAYTDNLKPVFVAVLSVSLCVNLLMLSAPLYSMQIFDRVLPSRNLNTLLYLSLLVLAMLVVLGLFSFVRSRIQMRAADWFERETAPFLVRLGLRSGGRGEAMQTILADAAQVKRFIASPVFAAFFDAPWVPIFAVALWFIHPVLVWTALLSAAFILILAIIGEWYNKKAVMKNQEEARGLTYSLENMSDQALAIRAMRMEDTLIQRWAAAADTLFRSQEGLQTRMTAIQQCVKTARMVIQALTTGVAAYLMIHGEVSMGAIIATSMLSSRIIAPFEQIIAGWGHAVKALEAKKNTDKRLAARLPEPSAALPRLGGELRAENLYYNAPGTRRPLLKAVSFVTPPGTVTAVIGPSGAGKSTLLSLLAGAEEPLSGSVRLDGAEVSQQTGEFGARIGFLPQQVELFTGTVKDNIARMRQDADDEAVIAAAQAAGVHELVLRLPEGYNTLIGKDGVHLSAGQKQRIGLARALFGKVQLLLLDEPNAHLDEPGERALQQAIQGVKAQGGTVFIISHKTRVRQIADLTMIVTDGMISDYGNTADVMAKVLRPTPAQKA